MQYSLLALLWIGWCALHSLLAAPALQRWAAVRLGGRFRYYRLGYNLFAMLLLVPVLVYSFSVEGGRVFWSWEGGWRLLQAGMIVIGLALFVLPLRQYDMKQFLGLRQLRGGDVRPGLEAEGRLCTEGVLGWCRHPWYTGALLLIWARDLDVATLVVNAVLSAYLVIGAHLEERKLLQAFGEAYRRYQRQVPMFLPLPVARMRGRRRR